MKFVLLTCCFLFNVIVHAQNIPDAVLGKWESEEKNLIVEVYKQNNLFKAKVLWFHDDYDTITPVEQRLDMNNPDKDLRNRKIVGADILSGLVYNSRQDKWVNGKIYDASSGRTWDATVWLNDAQNLSVRGFYIIRLFGKTMNFYRIK